MAGLPAATSAAQAGARGNEAAGKQGSKEAGLPAAERDAILGGNAQELLGLREG